MELFLNLVWVIASLSIAGVCLVHFLRRETRSHSLGTVLVALVALSVLLFPVISLSDDLHAALFAFEDVSRKVAMLSILHAPVAVVVIIVATIMAALCGAVVFWRLRYAPSMPMELAGHGQLISDRAPPVAA